MEPLHVCLCYAALSVPCNLVITCWEKASLLAVFLCSCHYFIWCSGSGVVFICIDSWSVPSSFYYVGYIMVVMRQSECLIIKVKRKAKNLNCYNQVPHLTRDTILESDKNMRKHNTKESQEINPFPAGDDNAARSRQGSKAKTIMKHK